MNAPFAATLRQRLEFLGLSLAARVVAALPLGVLRALAWMAGGAVYLFDTRNRRVALANLDCVFGDDLSPARKQKIARDAYRTFARTMLELFWAPNLDGPTMRRLIQIEGLDSHPCHKDPNRPLIYFCFHYSNFEWLSLFGPYVVGPAFVVTQRFKNPLLGPVFDRLRSHTGHDVVTQERAFLRMYKHLKKGGKFFMLTDLNLDPRETSVIIDCFGKKSCVTQLHAAMALRTGALPVPVVCSPLPDGRYHFSVLPPVEVLPDDTELSLTQRCWDALEPSIREHPELWIWAYKHWRFRPADAPPGRYPFYANTAARFDRKLAEQQANN